MGVGVVLIAAGLVGLVYTLQPGVPTQTWWTVPSVPPKTLEKLVFGANTQIENAVLNPAPIIASTLKIAPLHIEYATDLYIASYERDFSAQASSSYDRKTQSGFQIYQVDGDAVKLLYEEGATLRWGVSGWVPVEYTDLDRDGTQELLIERTWDGTGAYVEQKILSFGGKPGGIVEVPVVASLTDDELTKMFLTSDETLHAAAISPDGTGYRAVCKKGSQCEIRQSRPDAVGEIDNAYIYDKATASFVEVNYTRKNY